MKSQVKISYISSEPFTKNRLSRHISSYFLREDLSETGFDYRQKEMEMKGEKVLVNIWDVYLSDRTRPILKRFFIGTNAVILQIDSMKTVSELENLVLMIRRTYPKAKIAVSVDCMDIELKENFEEIRRKCMSFGIFDFFDINDNEDRLMEFIAKLREN